MEPAASRLGQVIGDRYRIVAVLGQGGMGQLFVAEHLLTQRKVALKLIHARREEIGELRSRFLLEARTAARVRHANVVDVLDMGVSEDGAPFLAMELLEGVSLEALLLAEGRLSPERALAIVLPIAGALAVLHDAGIIHRDVKPSNIFVSVGPRGDSVPKLLDFGLARAVSDLRLTRSGVVIGTPMYMSPEHAAGDLVTAQGDVWSLSVVLYECLAGEPPFTSKDSQAVATQVLAGRIRPLREAWPAVPVPLAMAVERGLRGDLSQRYKGMRELAESLVSAAHTSGVEPPNDPDPIGLPDYARWREQARSDAGTRDVVIPKGTPPRAVDVAPDVPTRPPPGGRLGRWLVPLAIVALVCFFAWRLLRDPHTAEPRTTPTATQNEVTSTRTKSELKPKAFAPEPPEIAPPAENLVPVDPAPPPPAPAASLPKTPTSTSTSRPTPPARKREAEPRPLPRSQGGVEIEAEWK